MIPLLTLGVPASPSDAILLGALILHNVDPGPLLMTKQPELVYSIYVGFFIAEIFMFVIGMVGIPIWVKLISLPSRWLMPVVLGIAVCGSYGVGNSLFDVGIAVFFGVLEYSMRRFGFSVVASLFGIILGSLLESNYRRALSISNGSYATFIEHPISLVLLLLALVSFFLLAIRTYLGNAECGRRNCGGRRRKVAGFDMKRRCCLTIFISCRRCGLDLARMAIRGEVTEIKSSGKCLRVCCLFT